MEINIMMPCLWADNYIMSFKTCILIMHFQCNVTNHHGTPVHKMLLLLVHVLLWLSYSWCSSTAVWITL